MLRPLTVLALSVLTVSSLNPAARAATRPTRLEYTTTTLGNGMQVVLLEDHSTPIVHAEIWYHVGSKNEKPGRTGFAHLFEHMIDVRRDGAPAVHRTLRTFEFNVPVDSALFNKPS